MEIVHNQRVAAPAAEQQEPEASRLSRYAAVVACVGILAAGGSSEATANVNDTTIAVQHEPSTVKAANNPNIVLILTDDLSTNLMPYMPITNRLIRDKGADFKNYDVEQSLCCTSRATILTGKYAHNTHVVGNTAPEGGYAAFHKYDEANDILVTLNKTASESPSYKTIFMGKAFNGYPDPAEDPGTGVPDDYVPPGVDSWVSPVAGDPYVQTHYKLDVNGKVDKHYRKRYLGDVLSDMAVKQITEAGDKPFFEEVSTYAPHHPYTYPKRLANKFTNVRYPRTPAFNEHDVSDKPEPLRSAPPISPAAERTMDKAFADRVRAVQVVDHMVGRIVRTLRQQNKLQNTYLVFTSDNGYFMGEHRRGIGKYDEFNTSLKVPLYVRGPDIKAGTKIDQIAGNVDLAPTFADIAHKELPYTPDGESLLPLLQAEPLQRPRRFMLIGRGAVPRYKHAPSSLEEPPEPDVDTPEQYKQRDFAGVVSKRYKLVVFSDQVTLGRREEFYDLQKDPYELNNLLGTHDKRFTKLTRAQQRQVTAMRKALPKLADCAGDDCKQPLS